MITIDTSLHPFTWKSKGHHQHPSIHASNALAEIGQIVDIDIHLFVVLKFSFTESSRCFGHNVLERQEVKPYGAPISILESTNASDNH
jgi:hypothetical protein